MLPVSGTLSLPSPGCFSPFPHGTTPLSVAGGTRALGRGRPRFPPRSPCGVVLTGHTTSGDAVPRTGLSPPLAGRSRPFRYRAPARGAPHAPPRARPTPPQRRPCDHSAGRVWAAAGSARRYSRPRACFFLLGLLRCFTSPACPRPAPAGGDAPHQRAGFPHSGTVGSQPARGLPHALGPSRPPFLGLRHLGHPPGALSNAGRIRRALRSIDIIYLGGAC